ncbi:MAG: PIG-L family deacetylase [Vicinamibacteria bacterium]|nr:PIG-L family deacetylase [Vicinamibacteria bacterium]
MRPIALLLPFVLAASAYATDPAFPPLVFDMGAAGAWQKILKLQTTASVLHTTAHPDDEHSGMLTMLSRGLGARTALLTINRGEAGDNAIGPELFDALGLIRTDELARAGQYYGLDEQYFTQVADYGFSKRLDEALTEWDREQLLRDMVRAIRRFRPLVVISRWQGSTRDGHGQHQAAGAITPPAVAAAADPARFPELDAEHLRPWRVRKVYVGGARENEAWHVRVETGAYDPVLGDSYNNVGRAGLSLQRSQTSGRLNQTPGPAPIFYTRVDQGATGEKESSLFDGLDTSLAGAYRALGVTAPAGAIDHLAAIGRDARTARDTFSWTDPSAAVPALARGLAAVRRARAVLGEPDIADLLDVKEQQFVDALVAALGLQVSATAQPAGLSDPTGPFAAFAPPPTLDAVTPGQAVDVRVVVAARGRRPVTVSSAVVHGPSDLRVVVERAAGVVAAEQPLTARVGVIVPADAAATRPYFYRASIAETRYTVGPGGQAPTSALGRPFGPPAFTATVEFNVEGTPFQMRVPVMRRQAQLPYGYVMRELEVLPVVGVTMTPGVLVVPTDGKPHTIDVQVDAVAYATIGATGDVRLDVPQGWTTTPGSQAFALTAAGARGRLTFRVTTPALATGHHRLRAVASTGGRTYSTGYQVIGHRDLPLRYLVRDATALVSAMEVAVRPGLRVGYVMGVGDELPAALAQLGALVTLLDRDALATGDLTRFDVVVTGTRAYAVRDDLRAHNRRLLDWVRGGGRMVVLYNTPEFVPGEFAPYDATLPGNAEEVSEQAATVEILAPAHPFFTTPNRITSDDFDGWIEQRGSKFFATWDAKYTALVSSHDQGQPAQRGGWVTAQVGKGRWTYMAYALHRQVPYGVPGAYRILANLISN